MSASRDQMSARVIEPELEHEAALPAQLISADSHVDEPADLWSGLDAELELPRPAIYARDERPAGGSDPQARIADMDMDGVAAEILYPTTALRVFALGRAAQERAFPIYNDWVASYCRTAPKRLFALPALPVYDVDAAIVEMQRCHGMGLVGALIWQVPDPALPFTSSHYEKFWSAAAELNAPVNFHILTGHSYARGKPRGIERVRGAVNTKLADASTTLFDLIWSGVFERHPGLKIEIVEAEIGWIPFLLQQWDYYYRRFKRSGSPRREVFALTRLPSEIFANHVFATFMDDPVGAKTLAYWGARNCMWSSDYPHANMTWPNSRAFAAKQTSGLSPETQARLLSRNVAELYRLPFI